ncbi:hypothetical protein WICPIJ_005876 [Wickerhamomyces pijperi]|uniref:Zn(2)-C6 fungal-type domain-containing protein n=1 Tax=Wickerhamomyces pijperi TaxID=599730 RepID=A0A9P8TKP5_WICPI|nr:hypothetical protein WICPIJ_005876 [Wickerhamomyces pijperi]
MEDRDDTSDLNSELAMSEHRLRVPNPIPNPDSRVEPTDRGPLPLNGAHRTKSLPRIHMCLNYIYKLKVRCSKEETGCRACLKKDIKCEYPSKFRSIELIKLKNHQVQALASSSAERSILPSVALPQIINPILTPPTTTTTPKSTSPLPTASAQTPSIILESPNKTTDSAVTASSSTSTSSDTTSTSDVCTYKDKIAELESELSTTKDFLSIFDHTFAGAKYFGSNSVTSLECTTMAGMLPYMQRKQSNAFTVQKKRFPRLIDNDQEANLKLVQKLVDTFFNTDEFSYFSEMYDKDETVNFIANFHQITKWDHDQQMITLLAILIDVIKNFLTKTKEDPVFPQQAEKLRTLIAQYTQIVELQPLETLTVLKSQIIMVNYYYHIIDFEKSWSVLFQAVANAYSLGLHLSKSAVWIKLNLIESVFAGLCSRPNCIHGLSSIELNLNDEDDEFQELKFAELLRLKNQTFIASYIAKTELSYESSDVFRIGLKFEAYTKFLNGKIDAILSDRTISKSLKNQKLQKAYFLLAINCSSSLKLHFEFFKNNELPDDISVKLLGGFLSLLEASTFSKLHNTRDKFAPLECLVYQFMLVFLRMLNHKAVLCVLKPSHHTRGISSDANHQEGLMTQLKIFKEYQRRLDLIFAKNPLYTNPRVLKAYEIISNVNLDQINPGYHLIPSSINTENTSYATTASSSSTAASTNRTSLQDLLNPDTSAYHLSSSSRRVERPLTGNIFEDAGLKYFVTDEIKTLLDDRAVLGCLTDITEMSNTFHL